MIAQVFEDLRKKLEHKEREIYSMVDESKLRAKAELETAKRLLAQRSSELLQHEHVIVNQL